MCKRHGRDPLLWPVPHALGDGSMTSDHAGHTAMLDTSMAMVGMDHGAGRSSAVYMTVRNTGSAADQCVQVTTDVAQVVELHTTTIDNNVAQMRPVSSIDVAANRQSALKSGSDHMRLIGVKHTLQPGHTVPLTFTFQHACEVHVTADVREF